MNVKTVLGGLVILLSLYSCARPGRFDEAKQKAAVLMESLLAEHPGITLAVGWRKSMIWDTAFGFADLDKQIPMAPDHVLRYYSLSKPITGVALAQLAEAGNLDLEAPVSRYISLPPAYREVRIRQLINHTAGVRHYEEGEWALISREHCETVAEALPLFVEDSLLFTPGSSHTYSTFGYVLLSRVVEVVSGQGYSDYLRQHIFQPAGMLKAGFPDRSGLDPVKLYETPERLAPPIDNSCRWGGGGLAGTSGDLVRFGLAVLNNRLLSRAATRQALSVLPSYPGAPTYGFGFGIGDHHPVYPQLPYFAGHSGAGKGGLALFVIFPEQQLVLALLSNRRGDEKRVTDVFVELAEVFLEAVKD